MHRASKSKLKLFDFIKLRLTHFKINNNVQFDAGHQVVQRFGKVPKNRNILLHDHFEGCIEIANPEGSFISSQGAKPRGMKNEPKGLAISIHPKK